MCILLFFTLLGIIGLVSYEKKHVSHNTMWNRIWRYTVSLVFGGFLGLTVGCYITMSISMLRESTNFTVVTHNLVAMSDGSHEVGTFTLGSGTLKDKIVYTYYRETGDGGIVRKRISGDLTTIYETDTLSSPILEVHIANLKGLNQNWALSSHNYRFQHYKLYLPKGSIIKEIKLDNE